MSKPVQRMWERFRAEVVPADAGPVQVSETRRAFWSGVFAMHETSEWIGHPKISATDALAMLTAIKIELDAWKAISLAEASVVDETAVLTSPVPPPSVLAGREG